MRKNLKTYNIILTNCDCSSDIIARLPITYIYGPKCNSCGKILGPMQWSIIGKSKGIGEHSALENYKKKEKAIKEAGCKEKKCKFFDENNLYSFCSAIFTDDYCKDKGL